jgi:CubicO group peptidase (beta-lactamase class C family)
MKIQTSTNKSLIPVIICIALMGTILTGCTKDLIYFPGTVQEEVTKAVGSGLDGMIVYVDQAGKKSFYSAGYNNRENQVLADPHCLFKIASISKLYIAASVAKLVAREELSLESTLAELIPEVNGRIDNAEEITLKMMLQHRSGIIDYSFEPEMEGETIDDYMSYTARVYDKEANFKPNKKYGYSNTNYLLIAEIMDRTLGYSHHEFIQDEILTPLNLTNTFNLYSEAPAKEVMSGYLKGWDPDLKDWDHPLPGGSMVASAEDVGIFLRALIDGTLLSEEEQAIYSSVYEYEHTGWLPGYTSIARYHSDMDAIVVQFVNTSGKESFWIKLERIYSRVVRAVEKQAE